MQYTILQNPAVSRLKYYYLSILAGYLLVPLSFTYMTSSFFRHPASDIYFGRMFAEAVLAAAVVIPLFALLLNQLLRREGIRRDKLDLFFASAHMGVPAFFFVLGRLNLTH